MPDGKSTCKRDGCKRAADGGKGYCRRDYAAWKRGLLPKSRYKTCRIEGCHKRVTMRGRCEEHAARDYPGRRPQQTEAPEAATP